MCSLLLSLFPGPFSRQNWEISHICTLIPIFKFLYFPINPSEIMRLYWYLQFHFIALILFFFPFPYLQSPSLTMKNLAPIVLHIFTYLINHVYVPLATGSSMFAAFDHFPPNHLPDHPLPLASTHKKYFQTIYLMYVYVQCLVMSDSLPPFWL